MPTTNATDLSRDSIVHILERAIKLRASDVHIEPRERYISVRYRVGGQLQNGSKLPLAYISDLTKSAKKIAKVANSEIEKPIETSFSLVLNNKDHQIRLSTLPLVNGEKLLFHIGSVRSSLPSLESLGYWGDNLHKIQFGLTKLRGIVLLVSTGRNAGALIGHSLLSLLNHPPIKIVTVEDPIVYQVNGLQQIEVGLVKGLGFKEGLALAAKQDPNVIMLSHLNDRSTLNKVTSLAKDKLVIVNLTAPNLLIALKHILSINPERSALTSQLHLLSGQTLLPKLCVYCREAVRPNLNQVKHIAKWLDGVKFDKLHDLEKQAIKQGVGRDLSEPSTSPTNIHFIWQARKSGCEHCHFSGHRGLITLNEVINVDSPEIQSLLTNGPINSERIDTALAKTNYLPLPVDGLLKCLRGQVSFDELYIGLNRISP